MSLAGGALEWLTDGLTPATVAEGALCAWGSDAPSIFLSPCSLSFKNSESSATAWWASAPEARSLILAPSLTPIST